MTCLASSTFCSPRHARERLWRVAVPRALSWALGQSEEDIGQRQRYARRYSFISVEPTARLDTVPGYIAYKQKSVDGKS
jgi:hypothetical protein